MDRTSARRPRRLRALLVAAALGVSMVATAVPASASPPDFLFGGDGGSFSPQGFTWVRSADFGPQGFTWVRAVDGTVDDGSVEVQGFTWVRRN
jgi:hypothetical protein